VLKKAILGFAVGWTVIIAVLCLIKFGKLPSVGISGADKYVHFTFHFVFTVFWGYYIWLSQSKRTMKQIGTIVVVSLLYGILIEILQETCTTTRHADIRDVMANLAGALTASVFFIWQKKRTASIK